MLLISAVAIVTGCEKNAEKKAESNTVEDQKESSDSSAEDSTLPTGESRVSVIFIKGEEFVPCSRKAEGGASGALKELLEGPTKEETDRGFQTVIPEGVRLNSFMAKDGAAKIDFSGELLDYGGGSATVEAIIKQITNTVLQSDPSIVSVEISVNGVPSGQCLQP